MSDSIFSEEELKRLKTITLEELEELYEKIVECYENLDEAEDRAASVDELTRLFHTITGTAALAGFEKISKLASVMEEFLRRDGVTPENAKEPMGKVIQQLNIRLNTVKADMKE